MDIRTDIRRDRPSYRDARTHLKRQCKKEKGRVRMTYLDFEDVDVCDGIPAKESVVVESPSEAGQVAAGLGHEKGKVKSESVHVSTQNGDGDLAKKRERRELRRWKRERGITCN